jgi:hypothetical protein
LINSTGTLEAEGNREFRKLLSEKSTLIAAIRMPGGLDRPIFELQGNNL